MVLDFTPVQTWYIENHLDSIDFLYESDKDVYIKVSQLSVAPPEFPATVPKLSITDDSGFVRGEWVDSGEEYTSTK